MGAILGLSIVEAKDGHHPRAHMIIAAIAQRADVGFEIKERARQWLKQLKVEEEPPSYATEMSQFVDHLRTMLDNSPG